MTFEEFAVSQFPAVLRFAAVLTGDRASAEDIVQEILIRTHRHWNEISGLDRPERYVRKMVVNEFVSSRRRLRRMIPAGRGSEIDKRVTPDHAACYAERDALLAELAKLPQRQRAVVVLRYYDGYSDSAIAETLGCTRGTVRSYACRALATLRVEMSEPERITTP